MFAENYKELAKSNTNFRKVLNTGAHSQIVAMDLPVGTAIGEETHEESDQIFLIIKGRIEAKVGEAMRVLEEKSILMVPAGTSHNISNVGDEAVKLLTIYAPPQHPDGLVQATKEEAILAEAEREEPRVMPMM